MKEKRMKIKTVMFDLDGTLLPMDQDQFTKYYFLFFYISANCTVGSLL